MSDSFCAEKDGSSDASSAPLALVVDAAQPLLALARGQAGNSVVQRHLLGPPNHNFDEGFQYHATGFCRAPLHAPQVTKIIDDVPDIEPEPATACVAGGVAPAAPGCHNPFINVSNAASSFAISASDRPTTCTPPRMSLRLPFQHAGELDRWELHVLPDGWEARGADSACGTSRSIPSYYHERCGMSIANHPASYAGVREILLNYQLGRTKSEHYAARRLREERRGQDGKEYLVEWDGFSLAECTWEKDTDLMHDGIIAPDGTAQCEYAPTAQHAGGGSGNDNTEAAATWTAFNMTTNIDAPCTGPHTGPVNGSVCEACRCSLNTPEPSVAAPGRWYIRCRGSGEGHLLTFCRHRHLGCSHTTAGPSEDADAHELSCRFGQEKPAKPADRALPYDRAFANLYHPASKCIQQPATATPALPTTQEGPREASRLSGGGSSAPKERRPSNPATDTDTPGWAAANIEGECGMCCLPYATQGAAQLACGHRICLTCFTKAQGLAKKNKKSKSLKDCPFCRKQMLRAPAPVQQNRRPPTGNKRNREAERLVQESISWVERSGGMRDQKRTCTVPPQNHITPLAAPTLSPGDSLNGLTPLAMMQFMCALPAGTNLRFRVNGDTAAMYHGALVRVCKRRHDPPVVTMLVRHHGTPGMTTLSEERHDMDRITLVDIYGEDDIITLPGALPHP